MTVVENHLSRVPWGLRNALPDNPAFAVQGLPGRPRPVDARSLPKHLARIHGKRDSVPGSRYRIPIPVEDEKARIASLARRQLELADDLAVDGIEAHEKRTRGIIARNKIGYIIA